MTWKDLSKCDLSGLFHKYTFCKIYLALVPNFLLHKISLIRYSLHTDLKYYCGITYLQLCIKSKILNLCIEQTATFWYIVYTTVRKLLRTSKLSIWWQMWLTHLTLIFRIHCWRCRKHIHHTHSLLQMSLAQFFTLTEVAHHNISLN